MLLHVRLLRVRAQRGGDERHGANGVRLLLSLLGLGAAAAHQVRERGASVLLHLGVAEVEAQRSNEQRNRARRGDALPSLLGRLVGAVHEREERETSVVLLGVGRGQGWGQG